MRLIKKILFLFFLAVSFTFPSPPTEATYKVKKKEQPVFQNAQEERIYRLGKGEILTEGGYLKRGVWGKMEGVVDAPPEVVWKLFIQTNNWRYYRLPNLVDSRAVDESITHQMKDTEKVEDFYQVLGNRVLDPMSSRIRSAVWTSFSFQYYDLPWPVANRWMIVKNRQDERRSHEGIFRSDWVKTAGNIHTLTGTFTLEPFEGDKNKTLLIYRIESDPGSHVPKFLLRWGLKKSMPAAIRIIRRESTRAAIQAAPERE